MWCTFPNFKTIAILEIENFENVVGGFLSSRDPIFGCKCVTFFNSFYPQPDFSFDVGILLTWKNTTRIILAQPLRASFIDIHFLQRVFTNYISGMIMFCCRIIILRLCQKYSWFTKCISLPSERLKDMMMQHPSHKALLGPALN